MCFLVTSLLFTAVAGSGDASRLLEQGTVAQLSTSMGVGSGEQGGRALPDFETWYRYSR